MYSLTQIREALNGLNLPTQHIDAAMESLFGLLGDLDDVPVKGRANLDTLLGCMLAVEQIIGEEAENG